MAHCFSTSAFTTHICNISHAQFKQEQKPMNMTSWLPRHRSRQITIHLHVMPSIPPVTNQMPSRSRSRHDFAGTQAREASDLTAFFCSPRQPVTKQPSYTTPREKQWLPKSPAAASPHLLACRARASRPRASETPRQWYVIKSSPSIPSRQLSSPNTCRWTQQTIAESGILFPPKCCRGVSRIEIDRIGRSSVP